jgi:hypothetical protein
MELGKPSENWGVFHGSQNASVIAHNGFSLNLSRSRNRFGQGIYFAPQSSKANCYAFGIKKGCPTHGDTNCTICVRAMLFCSLTMGRVFSPKKFGPPPSNYHSVHAEPESVCGLDYDEIAVFDEDQVHIIYFIA